MKHRRRLDPDAPWALVADADGRAARRLAGRLHRLGFVAYATARGEEALRVARAFRLALAVVDARLRDMPGWALVAGLQQLQRGVPVVLTAADGDAPGEIAARQAGIVYYAAKPLDPRQLAAVAARAVALAVGGTGAPGAGPSART